MNNALTAIIVAIGGASLVCPLLSRMQGRQRHPRRSRDGVGSDGGYYAGDSIGSIFGLSGAHASPSDSAAASGDSASSDDAGSSGDSGGGDSGGGGDGGGGSD
jgi:hypothetical protein